MNFGEGDTTPPCNRTQFHLVAASCRMPRATWRSGIFGGTRNEIKAWGWGAKINLFPVLFIKQELQDSNLLLHLGGGGGGRVTSLNASLHVGPVRI